MTQENISYGNWNENLKSKAKNALHDIIRAIDENRLHENTIDTYRTLDTVYCAHQSRVGEYRQYTPIHGMIWSE